MNRSCLVPFDSLVKSSVCYIFCLVHSSAWYFFRHSPLAGAFFCFTPLSGAIFLYTPLAGVILHGSFLFLVHSSVWNIFWCTPLSEAFLTMEYCVWCIFVWCIYLSCDWHCLDLYFLVYCFMWCQYPSPWLGGFESTWFPLCVWCILLVSLVYPCLVSQSVFVWCLFCLLFSRCI